MVSEKPTELVQLELRKKYEDFNLLMEDGSCKHFEFQSTDKGVEDLKRFRVYESMYSYQHGIPVTTYVLYSGGIANPITEFTEGMNTYRVQAIIMQDKKFEPYVASLQQKITAGIPLTKEDFVPLALCPLMGGKMSVKERIHTAYEILREVSQNPERIEASTEDISKVEAVIYTMAEKFLEGMDLEEIKEEIGMTRIGQMLYNDGAVQQLTTLIRKKLDKGQSVEQIADAIEESVETVERLIREHSLQNQF